MSSSDASIEKEKGGADHEVAESYDVDVAAQLVAGSDGTVDPAEANRVKRKIDLHILPLMCLLYLMQFADKTTLGQSAVLGILYVHRLLTFSACSGDTPLLNKPQYCGSERVPVLRRSTKPKNCIPAYWDSTRCRAPNSHYRT